MSGTKLTEHLQYIYGLLEGHTAYTAYHSAIVVELTNHDFPCPARKIAISSLSTSTLAALKVQLMTSLEHYLEGSLDGTLGEISYVFSYVFYGSIKTITEAIRKWFHFPSTASV
jgi:hypothetical protein